MLTPLTKDVTKYFFDFPVMRRIRKRLRTTMSEPRFFALGILLIEADITATLSPEKLLISLRVKRKAV